MKVERHSAGNQALIVLDGELTWSNCEQLRDAVEPLLSPGTELLCLDMAQVSLIDSVAIGNLMRIRVQCEKLGIRLLLREVRDGVLLSLERIQLERLFELVDHAASLEELEPSLHRPAAS